MFRILSFDRYLFEGNSASDVIRSFYNALKNTQPEESPRGSNKGQKVEPFQKDVGVGPGSPWCVAYVYGILRRTPFSPDIKKQIPDDASVKYHWENTKARKIEYKQGMDVNSILPGMIFCYLSKDKNKGTYPGHGHIGIVLSVDEAGKSWTGIEGNANPLDGSREGYGTFVVTRNFSDPSISKDPKEHPAKLLGFVDYFSQYRETPGFTESLSSKLKTALSELLPKTNREIAYLKAHPEVLKDYEENYNNRNKS